MEIDMNILIIDGQGGKMGAALIRELTTALPDVNITAVGTNSIATATMVKAGASQAATGENPVKVACRIANIIIGPIGIVIADSFLGEVTEGMALSVAESNAIRILIPVNKCNNLVAGIEKPGMNELIADVISKVKNIVSST